MNRHLRRTAAPALLILIAWSAPLLATDGYFDSTWAGGSIVFDGDVTTPSYSSYAQTVTLDGGGDLFLAGSSASGGGLIYSWLGQLLPNGQFVPSFGKGTGYGRIAVCDYPGIPCLSQDSYAASAIQPDGKYLILSYSHLLRTTTQAHAVDALGGNGGYESNVFAVNNAGGHVTANLALTLQSGTKILAAGHGRYSGVTTRNVFGIVRLTSDLSLDTSFGATTDAQQTTFAGGAVLDISANDGAEDIENVLLQPDGRIVLAGVGFAADHSGYFFETARFSADGLLDTNYGNNGATRLSWSAGAIIRGGNPVMDSLGRVLFVNTGSTNAFGVVGMLVARLGENGSLDLSFGDAFAGPGFSFNKYNAQCASMFGAALALDSAGRILVAGTCNTASGASSFALERLRGDGTLDTTFGVSGFSLGAYAAGNDVNDAFAIALDASGHPVVAGQSGKSGLPTKSAVARLTYDLIYTANFEAAPRGCLPPDCG